MFSFRATDIFCIRGRGMVLTGRVEAGKLYIGARAVLRTPLVEVPAVVAGIERDRQFLNYADVGEDVGLLIHNVDPSALLGGVERDEANRGMLSPWKVTDLLIEAAPKRWWEFWP